MTTVCLDVNVLLEMLLVRQRRDLVVSTLSAMKDVRFCMSVLSVDLVMYFVEADKLDKALAWRFLRLYEQLDVTKADVAWARDNDAGDFEDALQVAVARRSCASQFVTLDQKVEKMYGAYLPVLTLR